MGKTARVRGASPAKDGFDLPRGAGTTVAEKRKAIIPDPRNDENLAVAQTHLAMIRFHNRVVDTLPASVPAGAAASRPRAELVTKHYQWMLRTDYLPRICAPGVVNDVFNNGRKAFEVGVDADRRPDDADRVLGRRLPARPLHDPAGLQLEPRSSTTASARLDLLFEFSGRSGDLGGGPRLPSNWIADFRRLYDFSEAGQAGPRRARPPSSTARCASTRMLVHPLEHAPGLPHRRRPTSRSAT